MHLNVRSSYSLLNGLMDVSVIAKKAKEEGMKAIALTDFHVLYGALNFQIECKNQGVKPLFGMEVTIDDHTSVTVLAKNNEGYQSLIKVSYYLSKHGSMSLSNLSENSQNLVVIVHGENGPFESLISKGESINFILEDLKNKFETLYVGISHQESQFFSKINSVLIESATQCGVKCVALSKVLYEKAEDSDVYRVVRAIEKGTYFDDLTLVSSPNRHFLSKSEMDILYPRNLIDVIDEIVEMCSVDVFEIKNSLPNFETGAHVSQEKYLEKLSQMGLSKRLDGKLTREYIDRLTYELSVINKMGFTDYFLIVYDVIRFAKKDGIYVGPGRGSSAGSLVAYSLGITDVDPIEFNLLFERFLNPMRISMPDIDIDFPDDKRDLVVNYVKNKYGHNNVAHIVTFGTLKAKQAFRDVSRVFQIPVRTVDMIAKLIVASDLKENFDNVVKFRSMILADQKLKNVYDYALKVEGLMRHTSLHAAGIVITEQALIETVPIMDNGNDLDVIQYDMIHLEKLGLIKIDFLGLRNLTIIDNIVREIKLNDSSFNIFKIPLDDSNTFSMLSEGDTIGLFQLESDGMKNLLKKLKPNRFMDIVDTIALYRPGPMENIPLYLESRNNKQSVKYLHEDLKKITEDTFGVLVYQEQIMQVAQIMAGFNLAKADILRKAMGKKDPVQLATLRQEFIEGVIGKGYDKELGPKLYDLIEKFANYGFNKSHSVAYGMVSYQMAYLKANHPQLFYTHLLSSVIGSENKTRQYIDECRRRSVEVLGPNVMESSSVYTISSKGIRVPLTLIKGISANTASLIHTTMKETSSKQSFYDVISKLTIAGVRKNQLESLIKAGAFDDLGYNRTSLIGSLDEALRYTNIIKVEQNGKISLNADLVSEPKMKHLNENIKDKLAHEFEVLGMYFSEHPTLTYKTKEVVDISSLQVSPKQISIIAMIDSIKNHKTKHGDAMAFMSISDNTGSSDSVLFPKIFDKVKEDIKVGDIAKIVGKVQQAGSIIVDSIEVL